MVTTRKLPSIDLPRTLAVPEDVPAPLREFMTATDQNFREVLYRIQREIDEASLPFVAVTDHGARGVGAGFDDTEAIQAALDASLYVYFPEPTAFWNITDTLTFREGHTIVGASMWDCEIRANLTKAMFKSSTPLSVINGVRFAGLHLNNTSSGNAGGIGIDGTNVEALVVYPCRIRNVETATLVEGDAEFIGPVFTSFVTGFDHDTGTLRVIGGRLENSSAGTGLNQAAAAGGVVLIGTEMIGLTTNIDDTAGPADNVVWVQPDGRALLPSGGAADFILSFLADTAIGLYHWSSGADSGLGITGDIRHSGSGEKIGLFGATPVVRPAAYTQTYATATRTLSGYTPDDESAAYTGAADGEAKLADLNALRVAYENLRAFTENVGQVLNQVIDDFQLRGDLQ